MEHTLTVFAVHTLTDEFYGDEEYPLAVEWFVVDRNGRENPEVEQWILDSQVSAEEAQALREYFTWEEAEQLKAYLDMSHNLQNFVTDFDLKPHQQIAVDQVEIESSIPYFGDLCYLHQNPDYNLPFIAAGYITDVASVEI